MWKFFSRERTGSKEKLAVKASRELMKAGRIALATAFFVVLGWKIALAKVLITETLIASGLAATFFKEIQKFFSGEETGAHA